MVQLDFKASCNLQAQKLHLCKPKERFMYGHGYMMVISVVMHVPHMISCDRVCVTGDGRRPPGCPWRQHPHEDDLGHEQQQRGAVRNRQPGCVRSRLQHQSHPGWWSSPAYLLIWAL